MANGRNASSRELDAQSCGRAGQTLPPSICCVEFFPPHVALIDTSVESQGMPASCHRSPASCFYDISKASGAAKSQQLLDDI